MRENLLTFIMTVIAVAVASFNLWLCVNRSGSIAAASMLLVCTVFVFGANVASGVIKRRQTSLKK